MNHYIQNKCINNNFLEICKSDRSIMALRSALENFQKLIITNYKKAFIKFPRAENLEGTLL